MFVTGMSQWVAKSVGYHGAEQLQVVAAWGCLWQGCKVCRTPCCRSATGCHCYRMCATLTGLSQWVAKSVVCVKGHCGAQLLQVVTAFNSCHSRFQNQWYRSLPFHQPHILPTAAACHLSSSVCHASGHSSATHPKTWTDQVVIFSPHSSHCRHHHLWCVKNSSTPTNWLFLVTYLGTIFRTPHHPDKPTTKPLWCPTALNQSNPDSIIICDMSKTLLYPPIQLSLVTYPGTTFRPPPPPPPNQPNCPWWHIQVQFSEPPPPPQPNCPWWHIQVQLSDPPHPPTVLSDISRSNFQTPSPPPNCPQWHIQLQLSDPPPPPPPTNQQQNPFDVPQHQITNLYVIAIDIFQTSVMSVRWFTEAGQIITVTVQIHGCLDYY